MVLSFHRLVMAGAMVTGLASVADAADGQGRFAGHGPGLASCGQLTQALAAEGPDRILLLGWVAGYLTGANAYRPQTYDVAPWQPMEFIAQVLAEQCGRNPDAAVTEIMVAITDQLVTGALSESSPVLELEHEGNQAAVYRDVLRQAQARLKQLGLYASGVDGAYGPGTRGALEAFQESAGLPVTGVPDTPTLLALFYDIVPQPAPGPADGGAPAEAPGVGSDPEQDPAEVPAPPDESSE
ncbi:MAG: peptidoglycan-binding domain-containing protein [Pseudomonadota bacterium]